MSIPDDDVVARVRLAPDAGLVKSLGANHTLESAIADLIDNSIDAGAKRVLILLLTDNEKLVEVQILDNGKGMNDDGITSAMTIGHQRQYEVSDLGNFGMGLKAASFGHSDVLTVWSSTRADTPVGRRIRRADFSKDFSCEVLSSSSATSFAARRRKAIGVTHGTSVVWTEIRNAYRGRNVEEAARWLADTEQKLRTHLGVVFHRLIEKERLRIEVLVDERDQTERGIGVPVTAIDPFGYGTTGHPGYPKVLTASVDGHEVALTCHIWPGKTDVTGFRIGAKTGEQFQGFFIYRNDRLLQAGGWSGVANPSQTRQLARIELDYTSVVGSLDRKSVV
jgi:hypothetical protein